MFSNNSDRNKKPKAKLFNTTFSYNPAYDTLTIKDDPVKDKIIAAPETLGAIHALMVFINTMKDFEPERQEVLARSFRFNHMPITNANYESCELELVGVYTIYPLLLKIQQMGRDQKEEPYFSLWANLMHQGVYKGVMERHKELLGLVKNDSEPDNTKPLMP